MARLRHVVRITGLCATLVWSGLSAAQTTPQDAATAQALFDDGKRLMAAGKFAEACPKLEESERLDPAGGTIYALALCTEGQGKTATAWAYFNQALAEARKDKRSDREAASSEHVRALEKRLTRVRLIVPSPQPEGLVVKRDGVAVGNAQWSTPLPVDPKDYAFEASAPGKKPWKATVLATEEGKTIDVTVPVLADAPKPPDPVVEGAPAPGGVTTPSAPLSATPAPAPAATRRDYTWGFVAGGVALVAGGVGTAFGVAANSKWSDAKAACPNARCVRSSDLALGDSAKSSADASTVFFVVGGAAAITSVVLFLTAPSNTTAAAGNGTDGAKRTATRGNLQIAPMISGTAGGLVIGGDL